MDLGILKNPILAISYSKAEKAQWSRDAYVNASIVVYPAHIENNKACGFGDYDSPWNCLDRYYPGLQNTAQIGSDYTSDIQPIICHDLAYRQPHEVKLGAAEKMYKTLNRINRQMEKVAKQFGAPASFAMHSTHFGNAIGAKQVWVWEADKNGYLIPLGSLGDFIDNRARELSIECRLMAGKYEGTVKGWTNAPEDYDGFGTETVQVDGDYREVKVEGAKYLWQIGRYQSGLKSFLNDAEYWKQRAS